MTTSEPQYRPVALVVAVAELLRLTGIPVADDEIDDEKAFLAASSLLMALGVTPVIDNEDDSTAASIVREILLEDRVRTTTRSRRSL